jgi:hypothetical protein
MPIPDALWRHRSHSSKGEETAILPPPGGINYFSRKSGFKLLILFVYALKNGAFAMFCDTLCCFLRGFWGEWLPKFRSCTLRLWAFAG